MLFNIECLDKISWLNYFRYRTCSGKSLIFAPYTEFFSLETISSVNTFSAIISIKFILKANYFYIMFSMSAGSLFKYFVRKIWLRLLHLIFVSLRFTFLLLIQIIVNLLINGWLSFTHIFLFIYNIFVKIPYASS